MRKREALALAIFNETYRSMGMDEITSLNYKADKGQIYRDYGNVQSWTIILY